MKVILIICVVILIGQSCVPAQPGKGYKPIVIDPGYDHTKWGVEPSDIIYRFAAYTSSFDSDDDNNSDGKPDLWCIPEWVSYEIKEQNGPGAKPYGRPKWMTDDTLHAKGHAPDDFSYRVSGAHELREVKTEYRFVRGHMCPKSSADRISMEAGFNTHTVLNTVPQLQMQNNGIWRILEEDINDWADRYGRVWVICGPVFFGKDPAVWLGQSGEVKVAVPDALFKIVIRETSTETGIETLSFLIPNALLSSDESPAHYITSINRIEKLTGLKTLLVLDRADQAKEKIKGADLEPDERHFRYDRW